jgi:hypothetical protein
MAALRMLFGNKFEEECLFLNAHWSPHAVMGKVNGSLAQRLEIADKEYSLKDIIYLK